MKLRTVGSNRYTPDHHDYVNDEIYVEDSPRRRAYLAVEPSPELASLFELPIDPGVDSVLSRRALSLVAPQTVIFDRIDRIMERRISEYDRQLRMSPDLSQKTFGVGETLYVSSDERKKSLMVMVRIALNETVEGAAQRVLRPPFFEDREQHLLVGRELPHDILYSRDQLKEALREAQGHLKNANHPSVKAGSQLAPIFYSVRGLRVQR